MNEKCYRSRGLHLVALSGESEVVQLHGGSFNSRMPFLTVLEVDDVTSQLPAPAAMLSRDPGMNIQEADSRPDHKVKLPCFPVIMDSASKTINQINSFPYVVSGHDILSQKEKKLIRNDNLMNKGDCTELLIWLRPKCSHQSTPEFAFFF